MFYVRFVVGLSCALGLLMAITLKTPHEQQRTPTTQKTSGTVKTVPSPELQHSIETLSQRNEDVMRYLSHEKVPVGMSRNGVYQKLDRDQRATYAILVTFFRNDPVMRKLMPKIAACESSLRHTYPDGRLVVGPDGHDLGTFQVRRTVHRGELDQFGLDPTDFAHNVAFATHLFKRDGARHWNSSRACWETVRFHW